MLKTKKRIRMLLIATVILLTAYFFCGGAGVAIESTVNNDELTDKTDVPDITVETQQAKKLIEQPIVYKDIVYETLYDIEKSNDYMAKVKDCTQTLYSALASENYSEDADAIMATELDRLNKIIEQLEADVSRYTTWEEEYYYAAKTYEFFRQKGLSAEVACGIIGNMMVETSGGTLKLKPTVYSAGKGYYGLCQWSLYYRPKVADMPFEEQLPYLYKDLKRTFKTFGFCYKNDFTYKDFLAMDDAGDAAVAFAKVYERCASGTYSLRAKCAETALKYFTSK